MSATASARSGAAIYKLQFDVGYSRIAYEPHTSRSDIGGEWEAHFPWGLERGLTYLQQFDLIITT